MSSPFQCLYHTTPDLSELKIFGCKAFASTLLAHRRKLDPRAQECVYLGVKPGTKGFVHFDTRTREIFISRNVRFHEFSFPFMHTTEQNDIPHLIHNDSHPYDIIFPQTEHPTHTPPPAPTSNQALHHRRSTRPIYRPPSYLQDFHCNLATSCSADPTSVKQVMSQGCLYPLSDFVLFPFI